MKKPFIFLLISTATLSINCEDEPTTPEQPRYGSLSGTIIDPGDELPYPGAVVSSLVNPVSDTTDTTGQFFLDSLLTGVDTILVMSEIHDSLLTVINISEGMNELTLTPDRFPCFTDHPAEDTTRVYRHHASPGGILTLNKSLIYANFSKTYFDSLEIVELAESYGLRKPSNYGTAVWLGPDFWHGMFCVPEGTRPEIYFTPWGKENFCNFGSEEGVEYSYAVFGDDGEIWMNGRVILESVPNPDDTHIRSLIESNGLKLRGRFLGIEEGAYLYSTHITRDAVISPVDLLPVLLEDEYVAKVYLSLAILLGGGRTACE